MGVLFFTVKIIFISTLFQRVLFFIMGYYKVLLIKLQAVYNLNALLNGDLCIAKEQKILILRIEADFFQIN